MDASAGVLPGDRQAAKAARQAGVETLVVANKVDRREGSEGEPEAWALGFPEVLGVSAEHGIGMEELLDAIAARVPPKIGTRDTGHGKRKGTRNRRPRRKSAAGDRARGRRPAERRQVVARQRAPGGETGDRVGGRGDHPRLERRAARSQRPRLPTRRHGGNPAEGEDRARAGGSVGGAGAQADRGMRRGSAGSRRLAGADRAGRRGRLVRQKEGKGMVVVANKWDLAVAEGPGRPRDSRPWSATGSRSRVLRDAPDVGDHRDRRRAASSKRRSGRRRTAGGGSRRASSTGSSGGRCGTRRRRPSGGCASASTTWRRPRSPRRPSRSSATGRKSCTFRRAGGSRTSSGGRPTSRALRSGSRCAADRPEKGAAESRAQKEEVAR